MIKVSVMYPFKEGAFFDHDYYKNTHLPLIAELMGSACLGYSIDKGLSGPVPNSAPQFIASCHLFCESIESFSSSFGPHQKVIMKDVPNYTDIAPSMQISEVTNG